MSPESLSAAATVTVVAVSAAATVTVVAVSAADVVVKLKLKPNPEGGFYSETFRDSSIHLSKSLLPSRYKVDRPISTSICYLLPSGSVSLLHRIPCAETWHFYMGDPLMVVELSEEDGSLKMTCLGSNPLIEDQHLQYTVPPNVWFGCFPLLDFTLSNEHNLVLKNPPRENDDDDSHFSLVGCTCAPAFQFEDFELAQLSYLVSHFPQYESLISFLAL